MVNQVAYSLSYTLFMLRNGQSYTFGEATTLAEAGSVQLEYLMLGRLTGNKTYSSVAKESLGALLRVPRTGKAKQSDVLPIDVHPTLNRFNSDRRSIGASGDSYYEYLLKLWIASRNTAGAFSGCPICCC